MRTDRILGKVAHDQTLNLHNIFGSLDKGKGNPIHANAQHEFQIGTIFGGKRTNLQDRVWCVDAL